MCGNGTLLPVQEATSTDCTPDSEVADDSLQRKAKEVLRSPLYEESKLQQRYLSI